jgi:predicted lipid-binding transport protein (Tim44 family)
MIDRPENGHNPEMRGTEVDLARGSQTATLVAEPATEVTQPSLANPDTDPQTLAPMTTPAATATASAKQSAATAEPLAAATEPVSEAAFSFELTKFRQSFEEIQAEFIGAPRAAVEKAEALIDGLMKGLHDQLQRIHSNVNTEPDTEQLRLALLSYRELIGSLGGHRAS